MRLSKLKSTLCGSAAALAVAIVLAAAPARVSAQQSNEGIRVGDADLGGVVTGPNGPEAGVWVIAETTDLPTRLAKMVVTDERGRYVLPDLPSATYSVWVRGYGLVDSPKVQTTPGKLIDLTAVPAPTAKTAAEYYPAIYWYAMLKIPSKSEFPIGNVPTQLHSMDVVKTTTGRSWSPGWARTHCSTRRPPTPSVW